MLLSLSQAPSLLAPSCCEMNLGAIRVLKGGPLLVPGAMSSHPGWPACVGRVLSMGFLLWQGCYLVTG